MTENYHIPVLLNESIEGLNIASNGVYIDATFGGGSHSRAIYEHLDKNGKLLAFDQDDDAHKNAWIADNFVLFKANFRYVKNYVNYAGIKQVDGILADLGISTHHIDTPERGFSFRFDANLDMRMNVNQAKDASFVVNTFSVEDLTIILNNYGEVERPAKVAQAIVDFRRTRKIITTFDLVEAINKFAPKNAEQKFYAKVFQALRIEVNDEIEALKEFLSSAAQLLKPDGRFVVISYHSLEDSLVKNFFKFGNFEGKRITDMYGNQIRILEPLNNKVIVPTENEVEENNRSRSAKLRISKKIE